MEINIIYKEEVYEMVGLCMEVYNTLGFGFLEIVYKDAIEIELIKQQIVYKREAEFPVIYKGILLKRMFIADFLLMNEIIIEIKANADGLHSSVIAQTINYLKASRKKLGLIINFGKSKLEYKRVIF